MRSVNWTLNSSVTLSNTSLASLPSIELCDRDDCLIKEERETVNFKLRYETSFDIAYVLKGMPVPTFADERVIQCTDQVGLKLVAIVIASGDWIRASVCDVRLERL